MAKILNLTTEQRTRLEAILAKPEAEQTRDEEIEALVLAFDMPRGRAEFIVGIERGEIEGDVIAL
jgi:hypothetical protein